MNDKVLIVDDDPAICKLLEKVMHSNDLDTDVADCGASALSGRTGVREEWQDQHLGLCFAL